MNKYSINRVDLTVSVTVFLMLNRFCFRFVIVAICYSARTEFARMWLSQGWCFVGCIAYADDIILISASWWDLQRILNVCYESGNTIDIGFNPEKSFLFKVGKVHGETLRGLRIGDSGLIVCDI